MKRIFTCVLLFVLVLLLPVNAAAAGESLVVDDAGLLTTSQLRELNTLAERISSEFGMDVAILTVDSLGGKNVRDFADDYYDSHDYGFDGLILVLAMAERDWYISTSGTAIHAFTDYGIDQMGDLIVPYFSSGAYYKGFYTFLTESSGYMEAYYRGEPIDVPRRSMGSILLVSVLIGLAAAGITVGILCANMNTKRRQQNAEEYVKQDSFAFPIRQDIYLYSNVKKIPKPESNSSGRGGSSTHTSSSGSTHGGGGGKF